LLRGRISMLTYAYVAWTVKLPSGKH